MKLPSQRTVRNRMTPYNAMPRSTEQSFETISQKLHSDELSSYRICAASIDEMDP